GVVLGAPPGGAAPSLALGGPPGRVGGPGAEGARRRRRRAPDRRGRAPARRAPVWRAPACVKPRPRDPPDRPPDGRPCGAFAAFGVGAAVRTATIGPCRERGAAAGVEGEEGASGFETEKEREACGSGTGA